MDILLTHGYFLDEDPQEREVMKPYPPLGILYLASHLRAVGFRVDVFDSTFASFASFRTFLQRKPPPGGDLLQSHYPSQHDSLDRAMQGTGMHGHSGRSRTGQLRQAVSAARSRCGGIRRG